jgi:hypothetical protein
MVKLLVHFFDIDRFRSLKIVVFCELKTRGCHQKSQIARFNLLLEIGDNIRYDKSSISILSSIDFDLFDPLWLQSIQRHFIRVSDF